MSTLDIYSLIIGFVNSGVIMTLGLSHFFPRTCSIVGRDHVLDILKCSVRFSAAIYPQKMLDGCCTDQLLSAVLLWAPFWAEGEFQVALFHTRREEGHGVNFLPWLRCVLLDTFRQPNVSSEGGPRATFSLLEQRVSQAWGPHVLAEWVLWCDLSGTRKLFFIQIFL